MLHSFFAFIESIHQNVYCRLAQHSLIFFCFIASFSEYSVEFFFFSLQLSLNFNVLFVKFMQKAHRRDILSALINSYTLQFAYGNVQSKQYFVVFPHLRKFTFNSHFKMRNGNLLSVCVRQSVYPEVFYPATNYTSVTRFGEYNLHHSISTNSVIRNYATAVKDGLEIQRQKKFHVHYTPFNFFFVLR